MCIYSDLNSKIRFNQIYFNFITYNEMCGTRKSELYFIVLSFKTKDIWLCVYSLSTLV